MTVRLFVKTNFIFNKYSCLCLIPSNGAHYDKRHLEPIFRKEDLVQTLEENDPRRYQPIKAPKNDENCSHNFDHLVAKFIRFNLREGNKERSRTIIEKTFENIKLIQLEKYHKASTEEERADVELNPKVIFHQAIENCKPILITQNVRRGGVIYQVPIPVKPNYQLFKSMKWLIESAEEKDKDVRIWVKFAYELLEASKNEGRSVRKKQELHKICEANRAYAHFRWG